MEQVRARTEKAYNMTFCILSGIAIIMIVAGHVGYNILTVGDLFPYYSFHVPLFLFISGYFYKDTEEEHPLAYCKKKMKRLLVPYFIWNLIYGILAWLLRLAGFGMGEDISLWTLFLEPFLSGYQFIYNYAAWFVPVLFVIEIVNLLMRLILRKLHLCYEWLILAGSLAVGMAVVWLAIGGHVWGYYKMPGRILFLFPCFQMGQFYQKKLEKKDTLRNLPYFAIVIGVQLLLTLCCNGLAFSSVWCTGFANGPLIPYVTVVSGIAFWLRMARVLTPLLEQNKYVLYLGKNTYAIMMHHVMAFMLVKMILAAFAAFMPLCTDFDWQQFYTNIDYYYLAGGAEPFKMVYLLAGIILPLLLQYGIDCVRKNMRRMHGIAYVCDKGKEELR
ncbi:MAG: acyltransferase family protein [Lachnospiraceae bacterium]|nr:acyltransferase family protein [Lachnospiraceae bacterium]